MEMIELIRQSSEAKESIKMGGFTVIKGQIGGSNDDVER